MGSSTGELLVEDKNNLFEILSNGKEFVVVPKMKPAKQRYNLFKNSNEPADHPDKRP